MDRLTASSDRLAAALERVFDVRVNADTLDGQERANAALEDLVTDPLGERSQHFFNALKSDRMGSENSSAWKYVGSKLKHAGGVSVQDHNNFLLDDFVYEEDRINSSSDVEFKMKLAPSLNPVRWSVAFDKGACEGRAYFANDSRQLNYFNIYKFLLDASSRVVANSSERKQGLRFGYQDQSFGATMRMLSHEVDSNCFELSWGSRRRFVAEFRTYAMIFTFCNSAGEEEGEPIVVLSPATVEKAENVADRLNAQHSQIARSLMAQVIGVIKNEISV